ncbi:hypothetical protein J2S97_003914 [Arthrobacter oryzae]|nr:hypothetical protein [Arthrobacter oryzae]
MKHRERRNPFNAYSLKCVDKASWSDKEATIRAATSRSFSFRFRVMEVRLSTEGGFLATRVAGDKLSRHPGAGSP